MNYFNKQRLLIWALVILVVINLGAVGTIIYQNYRLNQRLKPFRFDKERFDRDKKKDMDDERFFRKELGLNDDQLSEFREYKRQFFTQTKDLMQEIRSKRKQLLKELSKEEPNRDTLMMLSEDIGQLYTRHKKVTFDHFLELKQLVNPEQRRRLNRMLMEMLDHDKPMHRHGRYRHGCDDDDRRQRFDDRDKRKQGFD